MRTPTPDPAPTFPPAGLDRRFYAFGVDRLLAWSAYAGAGWAAWSFLIDRDRLWLGVGAMVGAVLLVSLLFAVVLGLTGASPGKALLGLRVVHHGTGTPIGVGRALLRGLVLGGAMLPTFGLGVATLAWTALMDPGRQRRGLHDRLAHSVVVDVRPPPPEVAQEQDRGPRHVVNLTAMRLVPAAPAPAPAAVPAPAAPAPVAEEVRPHEAAPPFQPPAFQPPPAQAPPFQPPPPAQAPPAPAPPFQPPAAAQPQPQAQAPSQTPSQPAVDRTVLRPGSPVAGARWRVSFDTGTTFVVEGLGLVGRRPEGRTGEQVRHLVPLPSQDMSLSKTHAQFHLSSEGVLVVMDRGSTNGSLLRRQGVTRDLTAGKPATLLDGDVVRFGDREMQVALER
ncbi:RDD family protein [Nocardioides pacificus]